MDKDINYYLNEAKRQGAKGEKVIRIALLSSFTSRGLNEVLKVKCGEIGLRADIYSASYNQIDREMISKESDLQKFKPQITFLLVDRNYIFGKEGKIKKKKTKKGLDIKEFQGKLNRFLETTSGIIIVSNLKKEPYSSLGINRYKLGEVDESYLFDEWLKKESQKNPRIYDYDMMSFFLKHGEYNVIDDKLRYLGDYYISPSYIPLLGEELMAYVKAYSSKNRKCIVLDLDNTLWGGIVGEDGMENIKLDIRPPGNAFRDFQKYLLGLNKRGIILAINSNNNPADALKVIRKHPLMILKEKNFAAVRINWKDKVSNMKSLAGELNIGMDSMIFIDDSPVNRDLVKKSLPEILVLDLPKDPSLYVRALKDLTDLEVLQLTKEDLKRSEMYYHNRRRKEFREESADMESFLKELKINVTLQKANEFTIPRITQLVNKTNQFNLSSKRYSEEEINQMSSNKRFLIYSFDVTDKYGDDGTVGAFIIERLDDKTWKIDSFLMSCRVIGRDIEKAVMEFIVKLAKAERTKKIIGIYIPTEKNVLVKDFYKDLGFKQIASEEYELQKLEKIKKINYIEMKCLK